MTTELAKRLAERNDSDYQNGDVHQSILNLAYEKWQGVGWSRTAWMGWVELELGKLAAFAVLIGKYNQQVCNGGHAQYFDNGYASGDGGCFVDHDLDCPLHAKMVSLFQELKFDSTKLGREVLAILEDFKVENITDFHHEWDDDLDEEVEYEDGTHPQVVNGGELDDRYYKINEKWMEYLNKRFTKALT
jgi:hypothetical protein